MFNHPENNESESEFEALGIEDCSYEELGLRLSDIWSYYFDVARRGNMAIGEQAAYLDKMNRILQRRSAIKRAGGEEKFLQMEKEIKREIEKFEETKKQVETYKREAQGGRAAA